jgi:hypothetical protein
MPVSQASSDKDIVLWQETDKDTPVAESAIFIKKYSDVIALGQEKREILITRTRKNLYALAREIKKIAEES